ncbi:Transcription factor [Clarireedia jacksonii]
MVGGFPVSGKGGMLGKGKTKETGECAEEIDEVGTRLWNLGTRVRRVVLGGGDEKGDSSGVEKKEMRKILLMVRVYAFLMLDFAGGGAGKMGSMGKKSRENLLRLMKAGIKTGKNCLDEGNIEYSKTVLEKVAAYSDILLKATEEIGTPEEKSICGRLTAEYFVLRTVLAWRHDDMQLAEHMYNKSINSKDIFDHDTTESLSDTLYEMGKELLSKKQYTLAVKWLQRAYEVLNGDDLDKLSTNATELRISILQTLVKALLETKSDESLQRAQDLVDLLESEIGDKMVVLLLKLECLSEKKDDVFDGLAYGGILQRMIRTMSLSIANLRLFLFHARKLNDKAPSLAIKALDELARLRIKEWVEVAALGEWLEKVLVTRIWMVVNGRDTDEGFASTEAFLDLIADNVVKGMSTEATMAVHMLLWKRIEASYGLLQYETTEKWCRLGLHRLFEKSGELNVVKISRKLLLCALGRGDVGSARDVFGSMSSTAKEEPLTRFLMYKIAIRSEEVEFAAECLEKVAISQGKDPTLLYACVLDAQQAGNRTHVLNALRLVLEKCGYNLPGNVHLPSLLRTTIVLLAGVIEGAKTKEEFSKHGESVERLCQLFEGALQSIQKSPNRDVWTILELEWFSRNTYNLSLKNLSLWDPRQSLRLLTCCIDFIDLYPSDIGSQAHDDITLRKMFCNFTSATALVSLARSEDLIETQLQDYLNLRKHVASFDSHLQEKLEPGKLEELTADDLLQKLAVLLAFDFEAACRLKDWDSLGECILKAEICRCALVWELMADCILGCEAPTLVTTMKKIINATWELEAFDSVKLSKYIRCLFQVAIASNAVVAEELLDQVQVLAKDSAESDIPYPTPELDWLATKSFNHAIDLYIADQDDGCRRWAEKALNIAKLCRDGGALYELLRGKLAGLRWG